ncbi:MAG TPA: tetratricopeptide repeat protein, partial [Thermoanaerobaculia bacterium]|nr:tetratricopeptide repeat protein [Thermoanaerobaculia bacterium]
LEAALTRTEPGGTPSPAEVHERLARVYEKLGNRAEAVAELQAALTLAPGRADWPKSLVALKK